MDLDLGPVDDDEAFAWFFVTEFPRVVRLLGVVLGDVAVAEDVAQDAFVRLHRHWATVSQYESPEAWVRRVAINRSMTWRRREWLRRDREVAAYRDHPAPAAADEPEPRHDDVIEAVRRLRPRERALVGLYHLEDRPLSEVAEVLGLREGTAKVALHRARRRLAELLAERVDTEADR